MQASIGAVRQELGAAIDAEAADRKKEVLQERTERKAEIAALKQEMQQVRAEATTARTQPSQESAASQGWASRWKPVHTVPIYTHGITWVYIGMSSSWPWFCWSC